MSTIAVKRRVSRPASGAGMTRAQKVATAQRLRAEGLLLRQIADRMGVAVSTAAAYLADPDLSKQRARRERYSVPCDWCGGRTDGSGGYAHRVSVCRECRRWSEDAIVDAIRRWAEAHGGIPPTGAEWVRAAADHPAATTVCMVVGWNEALLRAGFALHCDRRPETQEWVIAELRNGRSPVEIANKLGVSPGAIYQRVRYRGMTVRQLRTNIEASA